MITRRAQHSARADNLSRCSSSYLHNTQEKRFSLSLSRYFCCRVFFFCCCSFVVVARRGVVCVRGTKKEKRKFRRKNKKERKRMEEREEEGEGLREQGQGQGTLKRKRGEEPAADLSDDQEKIRYTSDIFHLPLVFPVISP